MGTCGRDMCFSSSAGSGALAPAPASTFLPLQTPERILERELSRQILLRLPCKGMQWVTARRSLATTTIPWRMHNCLGGCWMRSLSHRNGRNAFAFVTDLLEEGELFAQAKRGVLHLQHELLVHQGHIQNLAAAHRDVSVLLSAVALLAAMQSAALRIHHLPPSS